MIFQEAFKSKRRGKLKTEKGETMNFTVIQNEIEKN